MRAQSEPRRWSRATPGTQRTLSSSSVEMDDARAFRPTRSLPRSPLPGTLQSSTQDVDAGALKAELRRLQDIETSLAKKLEVETITRQQAEERAAKAEAALAREMARQREAEAGTPQAARDAKLIARLEAQIDEMAAEINRLSSLSIKGDYDARKTMVLHMKLNPVQKIQQEKLLDISRQQLLAEGALSANTASASELEEMKSKLANAETSRARLKEIFHKNASDFREACYHLLGYEISLTNTKSGYV